MSPVNRKLAAGATLVALGGLTAVAVGQPGSAATKKAAAAPVEVRTETIEKTVRIVRHEKPKHKRVRTPSASAVVSRSASAAPPSASVTAAATGSAPAYSPPAQRRAVSVPSPAASPSHLPVTSRTSGSSGSKGGKGGDDSVEHADRHEGEGGDD